MAVTYFTCQLVVIIYKIVMQFNELLFPYEIHKFPLEYKIDFIGSFWLKVSRDTSLFNVNCVNKYKVWRSRGNFAFLTLSSWECWVNSLFHRF